MITNLAFKGGGVRGIAFVGALRELELVGQLNEVKRVAGTSAGALVAAMYALGYSIDQIEKLMQGLDFKQFEDGFNPLRVASHYGLYEGNYILDFAHSLLENCGKGLNAHSTFAEMRAAGCKDLYVFATNLNTHSVVELSADSTPGAIVAEAVRASMSIPIFFKAWQFSNSIPDDHIYVDGGMVFNYPLSFFDNDRFVSNNADDINLETVGLYVHSKTPAPEKNELSFHTLMHYTRHLFETLLDVQDQDIGEDGDQVKRSIMIDDLGIKSTDFHLTGDDMNNLVASGALGAKSFLSGIAATK